MKVVVYTDGSCRNSIGGYSFIIITNDYELEWSDHAINTTNNRMELTAVIEALRCIPLFSDITIHSDSQWVINCAKKIWKRNKNLDLWKLYDALEPN